MLRLCLCRLQRAMFFLALRPARATPACPSHRFVDDPELAYVITRARQVHDFWHVLFGCHTNAFGEVALKAVEFVQVTSPGGAQLEPG